MSGIVKMTAAVHPFKANHKNLDFAEGVTIKEMVDCAQPDSRQIKHARVFIQGNVIPREVWHKYRPKADDIVEIRAFPVPRGGDGGGKDVLRIVLTIAVIALAMVTGGAALGLLGFSQATIAASGAWVTFAGAFVTGVIATVGMLAVNALVPTRSAKLDSLSSVSGTSDSPTLFIEGARNSLNPFGPIPIILGKYRSTPPLGSKAYTEILGDKQYVRMLFIWGIGPLSIDISSIKIGETPLTEFEGVQIEHREGYSDDEPLTLFPTSINQLDFSILLNVDTDWVSRTSTIYADELSIDLTFPQGMVEFADTGARSPRSVNVEVEYRAVGAGSWSKIDTSNEKFSTTANSDWLNKSGDLLNSITFTHNRTSAIKHGIKWGVAARGQYDVRVRRTTATSESTQIYDTTTWTALRTIRNDDPVNMPVPVAKTAIVIQATDQLNGVLDTFNAIVTTVCKDWDTATQTWIERATQNPASLFRHVLQGNGIAFPLSDLRIDLDALQDWHEFCEEKGFKFNMIRDYSSSVWETLADVASAGRAAPAQVDGKWSVVVEDVRTSPVSFITPRNSFDFKAQKFFLNPPHGWRIRFPNEQQGYTFDERRVYADGYNDDNATRFETLELPGVTDPDQVYKLGRYRIAQGLNQPERWSFKQDMEYLTYKRGDRVVISHDIMLVGLASGRITGITADNVGDTIVTDEEGNIVLNEDMDPVTIDEAYSGISELTLDEAVTMEAGKLYGIAIRTLTNAKVTAPVVNVPGTTKSITLITPIPDVGSPALPAVNIGDIFSFGIFGLETDDATIINIVPSNDFQAQVIAIPYREAIFSADTEEIPVFDTKITPLTAIPAPVINSIVSDESAMVISSTGTLKIRIGISFNPLDKNLFGIEPELRVQMRPSGTGESHHTALLETQTEGHIFIGDVRTGEEWDIRMRFVIPGRLPGPWTTIPGYRVVGRSTTPASLSGMTISVFGAQALIRWDKPLEIDVIFGGEVVFRHSPVFEGATWAESVTIGQSAMARSLFAVLPLKAGTYLARVYDVDGNPSEEVTTVTTKQASVHEFVNLDSLNEDPGWLGTHDGTVEDSDSLKLDEGSPRELTGTYTFAQGFDFLAVERVRLTTRIAVTAYSISDEIDDRLDPIDTWEDFDGTLQAGADARVFVRHTDDDPESSPVAWSAWERLDSAEFEARAFQFKIVLTVDSEDFNIIVSDLGVDAEQIA